MTIKLPITDTKVKHDYTHVRLDVSYNKGEGYVALANGIKVENRGGYDTETFIVFECGLTKMLLVEATRKSAKKEQEAFQRMQDIQEILYGTVVKKLAI